MISKLSMQFWSDITHSSKNYYEGQNCKQAGFYLRDLKHFIFDK